MAEIKFPPLLEALRKRFQAAWDPSLSDTVVPTVVLESDRPEWKFLAGEQLFGAVHRIQPQVAAGTFVHAQLFNPPGSRVVAVVLRAGIAHSSPGATTFGPSEYRMTRRDAPAPDLHLVTAVRDARWDLAAGNNRSAVCQLRTEVNAVLQSDLDVARLWNNFGMIVGNVSYYGSEWNWPLILGPGSGYQLVSTTQVASQRNDYQFSWLWSERPMSSWELQAIPGG